MGGASETGRQGLEQAPRGRRGFAARAAAPGVPPHTPQSPGSGALPWVFSPCSLSSVPGSPRASPRASSPPPCFRPGRRPLRPRTPRVRGGRATAPGPATWESSKSCLKHTGFEEGKKESTTCTSQRPAGRLLCRCRGAPHSPRVPHGWLPFLGFRPGKVRPGSGLEVVLDA